MAANVREHKVEETDRHYWIYLSSLYRDPLVYFRELYQNAVDAGSPVLDIKRTARGLVASDTGTGMTRDFIDSVWPKPGLGVKSADKMGRFSEGRLTYLKPFAELIGDKMVLNGTVIVVSSTGAETTRLEWYDPRHLRTMDVPLQPRGTTVTWEVRDGEQPDKYFPTPQEIEQYYAKTVILPKLKISLGGRQLDLGWKATRVPDGGERKLWGYSSEVNEQVQFPYEPYLSSTANGQLMITENGLRVTETHLGAGTFGGIMDFKPVPSSRGEPCGITNVSRDTIMVRTENVVQAYIEDGILSALQILSRGEIEKMTADIVSLLQCDALRVNQGVSDLYKRVAGLIVIDGATIRELIVGGYLWSVADDQVDQEYAFRASQKGYKVKAVTRDLAAVLNNMGMKSLDSVAQALKREFRFQGLGGSERTASVLGGLSAFENPMQATLTEIEAEGIEKRRKGTPVGSIERVIPDVSHQGGFRSWSFPPDEVLDDEEVEEVTKPMTFLRWQVFCAKCSDPEVAGFIHRGRIGFNMNNKNVLDAIETGSRAYLLFILTHEITHGLGYMQHDDRFVAAHNLLYGRFLLKFDTVERKPAKTEPAPKPVRIAGASPAAPSDPQEVLAKELAERLLGSLGKQKRP